MKKPIITAISFLFKDERIVLQCRSDGRFRVPVPGQKNSRTATRYENLTARQIINHKIIRECDPTLYLQGNDKMRVFNGGDNSYLPARSDGVISKHDDLYKRKRQRIPPTLKLKKSLDAVLSDSYHDYMQTGMFGDWPYDDEYDQD